MWLDWIEDRGGWGVLGGGGDGGSGRASAARTPGLGGGAIDLGGSWGWRAPRWARVSGPLGCGWLLTPARRNAPLGSACAAVTASRGDRPNTLFLGRVAPGGGSGPGVAPAPLDLVGRWLGGCCWWGGSGRGRCRRLRPRLGGAYAGPWWWGYRLGVVRGAGEPLAGLGSLDPLGCGWLLTPARRSAPLGSACAAVTASRGDLTHTLFLGRVAPGGGAGPGVAGATRIGRPQWGRGGRGPSAADLTEAGETRRATAPLGG